MKNPYIPLVAEIVKVKDESPTVKTFTFRLKDGALEFQPGQFVELTAFGVGEAPFAVSSSPFETETFDVSVMKTFDPNLMRSGEVTSALHVKKPGDLVGVRGPYGNAYPVEECVGKDVTIAGGGIGLSTLRSLILALISEREKYGKIMLFYGARTPTDLVFKKDLERWKKHLDVRLTVDVRDKSWKGHVGVVTTLFDGGKLKFSRDISFVCGPPIMIKFTVLKLLECGFAPGNIYVSLERIMRCGIGKCGHCNVGKYYVCKDGPIFSYEQIKDIPEPF
jgi:NAD(P)H-flavin reductase